MLLTTTNNIEGRRITAYYGIVSGEWVEVEPFNALFGGL